MRSDPTKSMPCPARSFKCVITQKDIANPHEPIVSKKEPLPHENPNDPLPIPLNLPAFSQLTKEDIRSIIKEEVRPIIKEEIAASEKRMKEYIDLKIDALDNKLSARIDVTNARIDATNAKIDATNARIDELDEKLSERIRDIWLVVLGLIALIVATVAIPQLIIVYKERGQKEMQVQIDQLNEKLEAMQSSPTA